MSGVLGGLIGSLKASAPPVTFSAGTLATTLFYTTAIYAPVTNGNYFAFGGENAANPTATYNYSSNGTSWVAANLPSSINSRATAFNGSRIVLGTASVGGYWSDNGTTWTGTSMPGTSVAKSEGLWDGSRYVFSGTSGTTSIIYSTDTGGTSWASYANISANSLGFDGSNAYIAVNATNTASINTTDITSAAAWSNITLPSSINWTSIKHNGSIWVAAAGGSSTYATSTNGTTWTSRTLPFLMSGAASTSVRPKMAVLNGEFYYLGVFDGERRIYSSSNGIDWTLEFTSTVGTGIAQGWAVGGGKIISVGISPNSNASSSLMIGTY